MAAAPNSCSPLLSPRTTSLRFKSLIFKQWVYPALGWGVLFYFCAPHCSRKHTPAEGRQFCRSFRWNPWRQGCQHCLLCFTLRCGEEIMCLNSSGSFHTKLESRCSPQDISISITFAWWLCCYMISVSFFFLFPAFMWDFPSLFWPLQLRLWQWPAGSFWTAWSCFIFFCCHYYLPL